MVYDFPYDFENTGGTNMASSNARCEDYLAIDLAHLRRQGILSSGLQETRWIVWEYFGSRIGHNIRKFIFADIM